MKHPRLKVVVKDSHLARALALDKDAPPKHTICAYALDAAHVSPRAGQYSSSYYNQNDVKDG